MESRYRAAFITSNAFIGKSYAKVLHGFLRDSMAKEAKLCLWTLINRYTSSS